MINTIAYYLKVSRPGLWFATLWLYLLPTGQIEDIWYSWKFYAGLIYVSFPLNFLLYGWNDIVDFDTDQLNKRKNTFWFGVKGSKTQLSKLWLPMLVSQILFFVPLVFLVSPMVILPYLGFLVINYLYNLPKNGLRSRPPLELLAQIGYLLIVPLSIIINDTEQIPLFTYIYLFLFAIQSHLMGEVMDIVPDKKSGRRTTATLLGMYNTKLIIMALVLIEVLMIVIYFKDYVIAGILALGLLWLIIDLCFVFRTKEYNLKQMKLFAILSNLTAIVRMKYIWQSACLH